MPLPGYGQNIARIDINFDDILDVVIVGPVAGQILIFDGAEWRNRAMSGDITISATGVTGIEPGVIVDADISAIAEIAVSKLADGDPRQVLNTDAAGTAVGWFVPAFDGVVDAGGDGHWTTLQEGDDDLDGAPYTMWVKQGTYAAGLTVSTNNAYIFVEPGTVIEAGITLSGIGITLVLGAQCDIQGLITIGANCSLICQNGVDIDGILMNGAFGYVNGGGHETLSDGGTTVDGVDVAAADCVVENISLQTTAAGASTEQAARIQAPRATVRNCRIVDSDENGIIINGTTNVDCLIEGNKVLGADANGINIASPRARVIGNYVFEAGGEGIAIGATGDDTVVESNVVQDQGGDSVALAVGGDNSVVQANRLDGVVNDASAGSIVGNNNTAAF